MDITILASGVPAVSDRGFLGWSSAVLLHGERPMLFDTLGYNERYVLLERLRASGVAPGEVEVLFLSHFHFDHAVNYRLFPNARLCLHEAELAYARANHRDDLAIPIEVLADLETTGRLELLSGPSGRLAGVDWILAPGHTGGLYAVELPYRGKRLVLASDAVKNESELASGEVWMSHDREASARSIAAIRERADLVLPGHDRMLELHRAGAGGGLEVRAIGQSEVRIELKLAPGEAEPREWLIAVPGNERR
jgi:N-acyl homoserine lactone hydrolase